MPSAVPVEVTVPVLVMVRGLSAVPRTTGPVVLLLIVVDIGFFLIVSRRQSWPSRRICPTTKTQHYNSLLLSVVKEFNDQPDTSMPTQVGGTNGNWDETTLYASAIFGLAHAEYDRLQGSNLRYSEMGSASISRASHSSPSAFAKDGPFGKMVWLCG
jgi:hypothetical protein